jgi:hypothetical protein
VKKEQSHCCICTSGKQQYNHVGFEVLTAVVMKSSNFWDMTPRSLLKANQHFIRTCRLQLQGQRIRQAINQHESRQQAELCLPPDFILVSYSSTLKMKVTRSSETSADFKPTTWHYSPEDRTFQQCNHTKIIKKHGSGNCCIQINFPPFIEFKD